MQMTAELRAQALHVAGSLDPDLLTGDQAAAVVEDLAVAENALASTLMFAALRLARSDAWRGRGHKSPEDWLSAVAGVSVYEARRLLGTAKKAEDLPDTKEAMKNGDLSPGQADAVADAATADPSAEEDLLAMAAAETNRKLREEAAKRKAAATDSAARERRIRSQRGIRSGTDPEGAAWLRLYGPGANAAAFEAMMRPFEELVFRQHRAAGIRSTYENRRYDAFFLMLAFYANLAAAKPSATTGTDTKADDPADPTDPTDPADTDAAAPGHEHDGLEPAEAEAVAPDGTDLDTAGEPAPARTSDPINGAPDRARRAGGGTPTSETRPNASPSSGSPPGARPPWDPDGILALPDKLPGGNNVKVIVNVDHSALLRGHTEAGETCEIAGVGPVSVEAVKEVLRSDPFLAVVVRRGIDIVNVAHHGRGLNAAQRTAIEANGLRCRNIACNRTIAIQIDHRVGYATDPITELDNAEPHCPHCHELKTNHGWHLEHGTGRRRFLPPGHPDNPLTRTPQPETGTDTPLPTGQALTDLINQRPLTDAEHDELTERIITNLTRKGHGPEQLARLRRRPSTQTLRVDQPTLC